MSRISRRLALKSSAAIFTATLLPKFSRADAAFVPPSYKPDDLKGVLTPFGSIRAGNAAGTVPAWTGGYSTVPAGYKQGDPRPDPFPGEKPLFTITAANAAQYQDMLSAGSLALLAKHSDFHMDVYPSHRTAIAPQYVYDYIYKNASNAQLSADGNSVSGAYGGIPFPLPKNGSEVMWNHLLTWSGTTVHFVTDAYSITSSGQVVLQSRDLAWNQWPYYYKGGEATTNAGFFTQEMITPIAPPYEAGGSIVIDQPVDLQQSDIESWIYLTGQRRARRAPELQYDTPNSLTGGIVNWDESYVFTGKVNEYDFKLLGKREMYIPYNMNKMWTATVAEQLGPHFVSPALSRWELHRVWVVEMTVKAGSRNVDAKRVCYFDEDTGAAVMCDIYDATGSMWKFAHNMPATCPDIPCVVTHKCLTMYDLHAGNYAVADIPNTETIPTYAVIPRLPSTFFTPGQLVASAGGF